MEFVDPKPEKDLVEEARELLNSKDAAFISVDCRFGDHSECNDDDCWCDHHDRFSARGPDLLSTFITEVESLREDKKLLGERLEAQAETLSRVTTAATGLLNALSKAVVYAPNIKGAALALEAALTPKGEQR